jgi:hypothetical protein
MADEQVLLLFLRGSSAQTTQVNGGIVPPHGGTASGKTVLASNRMS